MYRTVYTVAHKIHNYTAYNIEHKVLLETENEQYNTKTSFMQKSHPSIQPTKQCGNH